MYISVSLCFAAFIIFFKLHKPAMKLTFLNLFYLDLKGIENVM